MEALRSRFPVHYYCMSGQVMELKRCISCSTESALSHDDLHYWTPAHWAACFDQVDCLLVLKKVGAISTPSFGSMALPLHVASDRGFSNCLRVLLPDSKVDTQDHQGDTALHKAARGGHLECISLLIQAGARTSIRNFSNKTATELAAFAGHFEAATLINEYLESQNGQEMCCDDALRGSVAVLVKRSSTSCQRENLNDVKAVGTKRRKFTDPVLQIATDLVGSGSNNSVSELQTSVLEYAASVKEAEMYASHYSAYLDSEEAVCQ